ncbi:M48 family metalloprotease [Streptomyces sp. GZWMJZ-114]|uniref:M48 family metalloprotease n=1 Tax=Streptomyces sp. GZWMJZ-114 TaxID=2494734 RepID=UPI001F50F66A|nr:M48 family metalloprotease [Streptomyces sp. GZWMJZ-114]
MPAPHAHHIDIHQRRIHLKARQRGTDLTTWGSIVLYLPHALCSLVVVSLVCALIGPLGYVLLPGWLLSGLLAFHRPTESVIARRLLGLRHPSPREGKALDGVWREVCARAGVRAENYTLWIQDDGEDINAVAAAGHVVGVTGFALRHVPNGQLGAVLAHELGHHIGGHTWAGLLGYWYALPARLAGAALRYLASLLMRASAAVSGCLTVVLGLLLVSIAFTTLTTLYGLPLILLVVPYLLAAVSRRSELRADQQAASLGFAPMLAAVLHESERRQRATRGAAGPPATVGVQARLLHSHPDYHSRLHALRPWLRAEDWPGDEDLATG